MTSEIYLIRRSFLIPLGLLILSMVALFILCIVQGEERSRIAILGMLILPACILFGESFFRRIEISEDELTAFRFFRRKSLRFADITEVESMRIRGRAFITLCASDDFFIFTNSYERFPQLLATLVGKIPENVISSETRTMASSPPTKISDIASCWIGFILMLFFFFLQLNRHP